MSNYTNKNCVVIGLGASGVTCVDFLMKQGANIYVYDNNPKPARLPELLAQYPDLKYQLGAFDEKIFQHCDYCIVSPGININTPLFQYAAQCGVEIIGDIEIFAREMQQPMVAITGSNAKGTVTTLVHDMVKAAGSRVALCGNIGIPVLSLLEAPPADLYILELSSFQLETTRSLHAKVACILNITADHLDRYDQNFEKYVAAKKRILQMGEILVANRDDPLTFPTQFTNRTLVTFGKSEPGAGEFGLRTSQGTTYLAHGAENILAVTALKIKGVHNWINALAACAIAHICGCPLAAMRQALTHFSGLPYRCQVICEHNGVMWVNDSKATNIGACMAAIQGLATDSDKTLILIAGGQGGNSDFTALREILSQHVREIILLGEDREILAESWLGTAPIHFVSGLQEAVALAYEVSKPGDSVLFSPACKSFDMFVNYQDRGKQFNQYVAALTDNH